MALADGQRIAGYYTLASASLFLADLPASIIKKLARYPTVPAVRMGRLAVDRVFKGQGLGGAREGVERGCAGQSTDSGGVQPMVENPASSIVQPL